MLTRPARQCDPNACSQICLRGRKGRSATLSLVFLNNKGEPPCLSELSQTTPTGTGLHAMVADGLFALPNRAINQPEVGSAGFSVQTPHLGRFKRVGNATERQNAQSKLILQCLMETHKENEQFRSTRSTGSYHRICFTVWILDVRRNTKVGSCVFHLQTVHRVYRTVYMRMVA